MVDPLVCPLKRYCDSACLNSFADFNFMNPSSPHFAHNYREKFIMTQIVLD
jgi:hypothetical protein